MRSVILLAALLAGCGGSDAPVRSATASAPVTVIAAGDSITQRTGLCPAGMPLAQCGADEAIASQSWATYLPDATADPTSQDYRAEADRISAKYGAYDDQPSYGELLPNLRVETQDGERVATPLDVLAGRLHGGGRPMETSEGVDIAELLARIEAQDAKIAAMEADIYEPELEPEPVPVPGLSVTDQWAQVDANPVTPTLTLDDLDGDDLDDDDGPFDDVPLDSPTHISQG